MQRSTCYACRLPINPQAPFCSGCGSRQLMQNGAYQIEELLGRTNLSVVYRAAHVPGNRQCVLKLVTAADVQLALNEIQILQQLARNCPFIPQVHRFWSEPGAVVIDMEFIPGPTLAEVSPNTPWDQRNVEDLVINLLQALVILHGEQVIHRDLKPENIKLHPQRGLVLLDFGIAKLHSQTIDAARSSFDPRYAPIEQLSGRPSGPPTDLFAVGGIAYRLLTGEEPASALDRLQNNPLAPLANYVPNLPPRFEQLIASMLELDMVNRPPTAQAALDLLLKTGKLAPALPAVYIADRTIGQLRRTRHIPFTYERLSVTADGRFLLGYNRADGDAAVYDLSKDQIIHAFKKLGEHICATVTPDGSLMVSGDKNGVIRAWSLPNGTLVRTINLHKRAIDGLFFIKNSHLLLSLSSDNIFIWDFKNIRQTMKPKQIIAGSQHYLSWMTTIRPDLSHDADYLILGMNDAEIIRLSDGMKLQDLRSHTRKPFSRIVFSEDSTMIAAVSGPSIQLWRYFSGIYQEFRTFDGHSHDLESIAFSKDGGMLAAVGGGAADFWDIKQNILVRRIAAGGRLREIIFLANYRDLIIGGDHGCEIWGI